MGVEVHDTGEVADVSELEEIHNTEGDEDFRQDGSDLAWQNLGSDIKYEGSSDREVPVGVTVTYWLDDREIAPQDLAGDDLLNLSSRIRAIKICDSSYQTFSGLAPGRKGSVKFIIETDEIARD